MTPGVRLAHGWRIVAFREIAENITERVDDPGASGLDHYVGLEHLDPDTLAISRWGSPSEVEATKLRFYPGDIIYARRRAYQRKLGVAEWDGLASAHALVLRARPAVCLPEFLPYFLQSDQFHQRALDISVGSLSPTINWTTLAAQEFALPPVDHQAEAVEVLRAAQLALRRYRGAQSAVHRQRESLLRELADRIANRFVALGDVAEVVSGESWSAEDESTSPLEDGVPVIGIPALKADGTVRIGTQVYVRGLAGKRKLFTTDPLTLLVIRTNGNADRIGNVYRLSEDLSGRALGAFIFGCRFRTETQRDVAFEYMRGADFQRWATSLVAGTTGLKNLPIRELRRIPVPDASTAESHVYLERLAAVRAVEERTGEALQSAQALAVALREGLTRPPRAE